MASGGVRRRARRELWYPLNQTSRRVPRSPRRELMPAEEPAASFGTHLNLASGGARRRARRELWYPLKSGLRRRPPKSPPRALVPIEIWPPAASAEEPAASFGTH